MTTASGIFLTFVGQWAPVLQLGLAALFGSLFLIRNLVSWWVYGKNPMALGKGTQGLARLVEMAWGLLMGLVALVVVWHVWGPPAPLGWLTRPRFTAPFFDLLGLGLQVAAIGLGAMAMWAMKGAWQMGVGERPVDGLVTTGIFALSRNPTFVAIDMLVLGVALVVGTPGMALVGLFALWLTHKQVQAEEAFLRRSFGDAYTTYCERTPRYLPSPFQYWA